MTNSPTTPCRSPALLKNGYASKGSHINRYHGGPSPSPDSTLTETPSQPKTPLEGMTISTRLAQASHHSVQLPAIEEALPIDFESPLQTRKLPLRLATFDRSTSTTHTASTRLPTSQLDTFQSLLKGTVYHEEATRQSRSTHDETLLNSSPADRFNLLEDPFRSHAPRARTPTRQTRSADVTPVKQRDYTALSAQTTPSSSASKRAPVKMGSLVVGSERDGKDETRRCSPRVDRLAEKPSVDNAQGLYLPNACVFVANLPRSCDDEQLKEAIDKVFNEFGVCYTKVHRSAEGMPFAHVQYETNTIATRAIKEGKGRDIQGRPCRTELSNAKVSLFVSSINGKPIDRDEVLNILKKHGDIISYWSPTPTEYTFNKLPLGGMFFRFAYFLDCADALQALRSHHKYRVESRVEPQAQQMQRLSSRRTSATQVSPASRRQVVVEQRMPSKSILVSNLPIEATYRTLMIVFGSYGTIASCNVMVQIPPRSADAVIEYTAASSAVAAVENQDDKSHPATGDRKLRVIMHDNRRSFYQPNTLPAQTHSQEAWPVQDLCRTQGPTGMHTYTPSMSPYSAPMSYYTLSSASTPQSPVNIGADSYGAQYASQYYSMSGHSSPNVFGFSHSFQLAEGR